MQFLSSKKHQIQSFPGALPRPCWGAHSTPPKTPSWWGGRNPPGLSPLGFTFNTYILFHKRNIGRAMGFLPCDAMHSTVLVIINMSVRPSVYLSRLWTVPIWFDLRSRFFTIWQSHDSSSLAPNFVSTFQQHDLQMQAQNTSGVGKMCFSA